MDQKTLNGLTALLRLAPFAAFLLLFLSACAGDSAKPSANNKAIRSPAAADIAQFIGQADIPDVIDATASVKVADDYPSFSVSLSEVPVREFLQALARDAGLELSISGAINGSVSMVMDDRPLPEILDNVVSQTSVRYQLDDGRLLVFDDQPYLASYHVDYLNISRSSGSDIDLSTQIDAISLAVDSGGSGLSNSNNSKASIKNASDNRFWDSLKSNLLAIVGQPAKSDSGNLPVIVNRESGVILVRARHKVQMQIGQFISKVVQSAQKQVLIEALVVEVSLRDEFQAGIDWRVLSKGGETKNFVQSFSGNAPVTAESIENISAPAALLSVFKNTLGGTDITATVELLRQFGEVKILSSPKINALNNQAAVLKVVDNRVYFSIGVQRIKTDDLFEKLTTTSEIKTVPIGLVMNVIPYISQQNEIILNVRPTISRILGFVADPNPDLAVAGVQNRVPEIQVREMESVLRVENGGMLVIGGLMQERISKETVGIPWLSDIPLLGHLFKYQSDQLEKTELLVFLRPVVIDGIKNYRDEALRYLNNQQVMRQ
ncbi:MAG: pilus (MSHA type) biogenesis protein MshL [Gammaproteobacteria bacterium]|nr:pilus (MSHA type) biogenesis protein MshL [Gammaproteobacteria bacterium]